MFHPLPDSYWYWSISAKDGDNHHYHITCFTCFWSAVYYKSQEWMIIHSKMVSNATHYFVMGPEFKEVCMNLFKSHLLFICSSHSKQKPGFVYCLSKLCKVETSIPSLYFFKCSDLLRLLKSHFRLLFLFMLFTKQPRTRLLVSKPW